jgi:hypothetical protein
VSDAPRCSAKGCRADATIDLTWRNPRLHDAARQKHWLACAEHADHLADFLGRRGFLRDRGPLGPSAESTAAGSTADAEV